MSWEDYYSTLRRIPKRMRKPVPFVAEALPSFKHRRFSKVLDLGCGAGRHCGFLARQRFEVVGVDSSRSALKIAKRWAGKETSTRVEFVCGTMTCLPFRHGIFDVVISISVIHHAVKKDIIKTVEGVRQVLRKEGEFLANLTSVKDPRYGEGERIEPRTFRTLEAFEDKRFKELHHYFTKHEVAALMTRFAGARIESLEEKPNYWKITATR